MLSDDVFNKRDGSGHKKAPVANTKGRVKGVLPIRETNLVLCNVKCLVGKQK